MDFRWIKSELSLPNLKISGGKTVLIAFLAEILIGFYNFLAGKKNCYKSGIATPISKKLPVLIGIRLTYILSLLLNKIIFLKVLIEYAFY